MKKMFLALLVCSSVVSADVKLSQAYSKCVDKSDGATYLMLECNEKEYKVQDAKLNKTYKLLMSKFDNQKKSSLKNVQRLWVQYKDAKCSFYDGLSGGTMDSVNSTSCAVEETALRAQELEYIKEFL